MPGLTEPWRNPDVRRYLWDDGLVASDVVMTVEATSMRYYALHDWGGWMIPKIGRPNRRFK